MSQLRKIVQLIVLFLLISSSIQSSNQLANLLNKSISKKQARNRWLTQTIEPIKSRFETTFTNDQITYDDAKMLFYLINEISGLESKLTSPPIYWYTRKG
jgi:predicted PurR-regulated permease PerM